MVNEKTKKKGIKKQEELQADLDKFLREKITEAMPNLPASTIAQKAEVSEKRDYLTFTGQPVPYSSVYIGTNSDPAYTWM